MLWLLISTSCDPSGPLLHHPQKVWTKAFNKKGYRNSRFGCAKQLQSNCCTHNAYLRNCAQLRQILRWGHGTNARTKYLLLHTVQEIRRWWSGIRKVADAIPTLHWSPDDPLTEGVLRIRVDLLPVGRAGCTLLGGVESMPNLTVFENGIDPADIFTRSMFAWGALFELPVSLLRSPCPKY